MVLDIRIGTIFKIADAPIPYGFIHLMYTLGVFIQGLAVAVRRLQDVGKSGWLLVLYFTDGQPHKKMGA